MSQLLPNTTDSDRRSGLRNSVVGVIYDEKPREISEHKTDDVNGEFRRKNDNELRGL
jgi:hypothetical protein